MIEFKKTKDISELPPEWDILANAYFQQRVFLDHTVKFNPCQQRFYLAFQEGNLLAAAVVYSLRLDLLTYLRLKSPIKMNIVGVPCSVSAPGLFGDGIAVDKLKEHIYSQEKGFILVLNLKDHTTSQSVASGNTLPSILLKNSFATWEDYLFSLRSGYRRRIRKIAWAGRNLEYRKLKCQDFTAEMYGQYLAVLKRSKGILETLSHAFFTHLTDRFILTVCYLDEQVLGWNIALADGDTYWFFLGGIDYSGNKKYATYFNLLNQLIRDGIESRAKFIDLGQTAEIPKMRLGGEEIPLFMEAKHHNAVFNRLIKRFSHLLEYKRKREYSSVFKSKGI